VQYITCHDQGHKVLAQRFTDDAAELENFARRHDRPSNHVYDCVATLRPVAGKLERRIPNLHSVQMIHVDIDPRALQASPEEVRAKVMSLPAPFELRDSGHGYHPILHLQERALVGTVALERAAGLRTRATTVLTGDRAVDFHTALLRRPGTHNYKEGGAPKLCHVIRPGTPVTLDEAGALIEGLGVGPWFGRGEIDPVLNPRRIVRAAGDIDYYIHLTSMRYRGTVPISSAYLAAKSMLFDGMSVEQVAPILVRHTENAARGNPECANWDWRKEAERATRICYDRINKYPKLYTALPPVLRMQWESIARTGKRPRIIRTSNYDYVVGETVDEPSPPNMADIEAGYRRVMTDAALSACALRFAYRALPAIRAKGYFQEPLEQTRHALGVLQRTLERARSTLIERGHMRRIPDSGRTPRLTFSVKNGGHTE
jgi:hypothetical protein